MNSITNKVELVGPDQAGELLKHNSYDRQRQLSERRIGVLARAMTLGEFKQGTQISFARKNGELRLTNGQHTLHAIIKSGIPQQLSILTTEVKTDEEIARLYSTEDRHQPRSWRDVAKAHDLMAEFGLTKTFVAAISPAIKFIEGDFFRREDKFSDLEMVYKAREWKEAAQNYFRFIAGASSGLQSRLSRSSSLSVGLVIVRYAPKVLKARNVADFWVEVALAIHAEEEDHPCTLLRKHVLESKMPSPHTVDFAITVTPPYSARYIARCWNAWARNEKFITPPPSVQGEVIDIALTPYDQRVSKNAPVRWE